LEKADAEKNASAAIKDQPAVGMPAVTAPAHWCLY